jgi:chromosome segregation ATPase
VAETDALDRLLAVAETEGALGPERLADFAAGLRERARLVLEERIRPLEGRVKDLESSATVLEKENAWRRETAAALEAQVSWLRQQEDGLRQQLEALRGELEASRKQGEDLRVALEAERTGAEGLRAAREQAVSALQESDAVHDRLLAHHRRVVDRAIQVFSVAASLPFWRFRARRSLLTEAASQFAQELR